MVSNTTPNKATRREGSGTAEPTKLGLKEVCYSGPWTRGTLLMWKDYRSMAGLARQKKCPMTHQESQSRQSRSHADPRKSKGKH